MKITQTIAIVIIFFASTSCLMNTEFNSEKWKQESDGSYPNRIQMVEDILSKGFLKGKTDSEMRMLLGEPNSVDSLNRNITVFGYQIQVAYGWDIDPKFYSDLVLTMNKTSGKISEVKFIESEDRRTWLEKLTSRKY